MRYEEATKNIFWQIKASKRRHQSPCISQVYCRLSTEEGGQNREITTDKEQMEQIIMRANVAKFQKGNIGLLRQNGLKEELAVTCNTHTGQQILAGTFICRHMDKNGKTFIAELEKPTHIQPIPTGMSTTQWRTAWMKHRPKRRKSSSPSGRHNDHYIAAIESSLLSNYHALMTNILLKTGQSLT